MIHVQFLAIARIHRCFANPRWPPTPRGQCRDEFFRHWRRSRRRTNSPVLTPSLACEQVARSGMPEGNLIKLLEFAQLRPCFLFR